MSEEAKARRRSVPDGVNRDLIKSSAKKLFAEVGPDGTSVREIAKVTGCTTGAIYFHYTSKEELYADILGDSLGQLFNRVAAAAPDDHEPVQALDNAFRALVDFYEENPQDFDLSLYLLNGMTPRGLTPALNRELKGKLLAILDVFRQHLARGGIEKAHLTGEIAGPFDEMIGALIASHTGRLRIIGTYLSAMLDHHTVNLPPA
jgi:AcrR family transcriptional regulator